MFYDQKNRDRYNGWNKNKHYNSGKTDLTTKNNLS